MKKRMIAALLTICLALTLFSTAVLASDAAPDDELAEKIVAITGVGAGDTEWVGHLKDVFAEKTGVRSATDYNITWCDQRDMSGNVSAPWNGTVYVPDTATTPLPTNLGDTVFYPDAADPVLSVTFTDDGTYEYHVWTGEALRYVMNQFTNGKTKDVLYLEQDIDLNGQDYEWGTARMTAGQGFYGQNHTIYNLRVTTIGYGSRTGFVATCDGSTAIADVNFQTAYIVGSGNANTQTGLLGWQAGEYNIYNVHAADLTVVGGENVGGLMARGDTIVGNEGRRKMTNCSVADSVIYGSSHIGSLTGCLFDADISRCYTVGCTVISTGIDSGGFISCANGINVSDCFTDVDMYGSSKTGVFIGEVNGAPCSFERCYASGFIEGAKGIGGFIGDVCLSNPGGGRIFEVSFTDCYTTALVGLRSSGAEMGGFAGVVGNRCNLTMTNCYAAGEVGSTDTIVSMEQGQTQQGQNVGGFIGYVQNFATGSYELSNCYYDKQTTAMREWGVGGADTRNNMNVFDNSTVNGLTGLLTTVTDKAGAGLMATDALGNSFDNSSDNHYPELTAFKNAGVEWGIDAELVRAYSAASTSGVLLDTWNYGYDTATGMLDQTKTLPVTTYCTVRDLTTGFSLTSASDTVDWIRIGTQESTVENETQVAINGKAYDVLSLKHQNGRYFCDELIPGIEWLMVKSEYNGTMATRRIRVIPTAGIEAGPSCVVMGNEYYDHADDVALMYSTDMRMAEDMEDITLGIFPDDPLTANQSELLNYRRGVLPIFADDDQYADVDVSYMGLAGENAENGTLYTYIYEVTGFNATTNEIEVSGAVDLSAGSTFAGQFNGKVPFGNTNQRFLISYLWVLKDGRVLQDAKLLRPAETPFDVDLDIYKNSISNENLYSAGAYAQVTNEYDADSFSTVTAPSAQAAGKFGYKEHAAAAWKMVNPDDTLSSVTITIALSDTEEYTGTVVNPTTGSKIAVPCVWNRIVYRDGEYFVIPETGNRTYILNFDEANEIWYMTFDKEDELVSLENNYYELVMNDVETDIHVDVVVNHNEPEIPDGTLTVSKTVTGLGSMTEQFVFRFIFSENGEYAYTGSKAGTVTNGGVISLAHGESVMITIPQGVAYTVTEDAASNYATTPTSRTFSGTISATPSYAEYINAYYRPIISPVYPDNPTTSLTVTKHWAGDINPMQPESITVQLYRDGIAYGNAETLSTANRWTYTWYDLDISYNWTVDETTVPIGYTKFVSHSGTQWTITNTYDFMLNTKDHFAYIIGYPDGTVQPEDDITRAEVAQVFFRMLTDEMREKYWSGENSFSDVDKTFWGNNGISTMQQTGVISGYPDGTFRPNDPITRAELVKIAVSFFKFTGHTTIASQFTDIQGHWAEKYINFATELGLVNGYTDGTFAPDKNVTRAEAMKIINHVLNRSPEKDHLLSNMITWPDNANNNTWYYAEVQEATNSHEYSHIGYNGETVEQWTRLLPVRDWAAFEREWSDAHSAPNPGEIIDG